LKCLLENRSLYFKDRVSLADILYSYNYYLPNGTIVKRVVFVPFGRLTACRGNQGGFCPTIQLALLAWPQVFIQSPLDAIGHKTLADPFDTGTTNIQRSHDLLAA
jgi:hypothetical protein